jgi:hypothetical protein
MERSTRLRDAKQLYGENFIGYEEITKLAPKLGIQIPATIPEIPYSLPVLKAHSKDCILILGVEKMINGENLTLLGLRNLFGIDPVASEPCFYNQDWYIKEEFMNDGLKMGWYLIRKNIYENTRGKSPEILQTNINFPQAVLCAFTFFSYYYQTKKHLWKYEFIWCKDLDHNGDRIYVGKYSDIDGINKNGFSIHRHLALRDFYGAIDVF